MMPSLKIFCDFSVMCAVCTSYFIELCFMKPELMRSNIETMVDVCILVQNFIGFTILMFKHFIDTAISFLYLHVMVKQLSMLCDVSILFVKLVRSKTDISHYVVVLKLCQR